MIADSPRILKSVIRVDHQDMSIERYLSSRFSYLSVDDWRAQIAAGNIQINGTRCAAGYKIACGDTLEFIPGEIDEPEVRRDVRILHETDKLLVVDKPPLLPVHPGGRFFRNTLWNLLRTQTDEVHIITRLDRETSGLMLIAKDATSAAWLQSSAVKIDKTYTAIVHGRFPGEWQRAEGWLSPDTHSKIRKKRCFTPEQPEPREQPAQSGNKSKTETAITELRGVRTFSSAGIELSEVEARLITGRTHQIRATLFSLAYPVLGDKIYGLNEDFFLRFIEDRLSPEDRQTLVLDRQALHCSRLQLNFSDGSSESFSSAADWVLD